MKAIKYITIILLGSLILSSCEELKLGDAALEKPPTITVNIDTIFSRLEYAKSFLWGAYSTLHYGLPYNKDVRVGKNLLASLTDLGQDCMKQGSGGKTLYYPGLYNASNETGAKTKYSYTETGAWKGIRKAYIFIENAPKIPDVSEQEYKRLIAEARVIIAMQYMELFRNFGSVPWLDHAYYLNEDLYNMPRMKAREQVDKIVELLDLAAEDLPWQLWHVDDPDKYESNDEWNTDEAWDGRFTKASALGLKARLLLFAASPLLNADVPYRDGEAAKQELVWFGGYDASLWNKAAQAAEDLINGAESNGYGLVSTGNYRQDFQDAYYKRRNGEVLISTRIRYQSPTTTAWGSPKESKFYFYYYWMFGSCVPTQEAVDMFGMANGLSITEDPAYNLEEPFFDNDGNAVRDPRLYETILVNGDDYAGRPLEMWIGGIDRKKSDLKRFQTGYGLRKYVLDKENAIGTTVHWPHLRLAEIYLSAAEALNEANNGPTSNAYDYVDRVRARVGIPPLTRNMTKEEFREFILEERVRELAYEEIRWYDIIRWKREDIFKQKLHGTDLYKNSDGSFRADYVKLFPERHWQDAWDAKWYFSAFPITEITKNYGLVQNPGWEM